MFCPQCGKQIGDGAAFCPMCGAATGGAPARAAGARVAAQAPVAAPAPTPQPQVAVGYAANGATAPKKRRSKKPLLIGIAAVLAVAAIGVGVAFATGALEGLIGNNNAVYRVSSVISSSGAITGYTYDENGMLVSSSGSGSAGGGQGNISVTYEISGETVTDEGGITTFTATASGYVDDALGRRIDQTLFMNVLYDSDGLPQSVSVEREEGDETHSFSEEFTYKDGLLKSFVLTEEQVQPLNDGSSGTVSTGQNATKAIFREDGFFDFDFMSGDSTEFEYEEDELGRLTKVSWDNAGDEQYFCFTYDDNGNLESCKTNYGDNYLFEWVKIENPSAFCRAVAKTDVNRVFMGGTNSDIWDSWNDMVYTANAFNDLYR